jgi:NTE family protein
MLRPLAFVLGGGGARGALQVGALKALFEVGIRPDLLVGTSIGAVNATCVALAGFDRQGIETLIGNWRDARSSDLLASNSLWLVTRAILNRRRGTSYDRLKAFFVAHGISPEMCFADVRGVRLILVAADINAGEPVLYGEDDHEPILEGLMASVALPPWILPLERRGRLLVDGGLVSNLPILPAVRQGAGEILALDVTESPALASRPVGVLPFLGRVLETVEQRETAIEKEAALARGIIVHHLGLHSGPSVALWDFRRVDELIVQGYDRTR